MPENTPIKLVVDITGLEETEAMMNEGMKTAFMAGFQIANDLLADQVDPKMKTEAKFPDWEIKGRYEEWVNTVYQEIASEKAFAELSEKALVELRRKLMGQD